jgi:hypothetical protein
MAAGSSTPAAALETTVLAAQIRMASRGKRKGIGTPWYDGESLALS